MDQNEYNLSLLKICINFLETQFNRLTQSDTSQKIKRLEKKNNAAIANNFEQLYKKHVKEFVIERLDVDKLPQIEDFPGIVLFPKTNEDPEKVVFQELPIGSEIEAFGDSRINDNLRVIKQLISSVEPIAEKYK